MRNIEDLDNLIQSGDYQKIASLYNETFEKEDKQTNRDYVRKVLKGRRKNDEIFSFSINYLEKRKSFEEELKQEVKKAS